MPNSSDHLTSIPFIKPIELIASFPISRDIAHHVNLSRTHISNILKGNDSRLLVIIGPCSIHDTKATLEYAARLKEAIAIFSDSLFIVMRVYLQKPRTHRGWKGLINDPYLDNSYAMNEGISLARQLLLDINAMGVPAGTEFLDPIIPHYLSDLISWCAIGARTVESPLHRELASFLPMPVGFKNNTDGNIQVAVDAALVATQSQGFLSINLQGEPAFFITPGNPFTHIVLRGSHSAPNYSESHVKKAVHLLQKAHLTPRLMIDCSHGNSLKNAFRQCDIANTLLQDISLDHIAGMMIESHLNAGKQEIKNKKLNYGQSITDDCIDWDTTLKVLYSLASQLTQAREEVLS